MKKYYLLLGLIVGLFACTQEDYLQDVKEQTDVNKTLKSLVNRPYDGLGFGYDITGEYLHPLCVKNPVLNIKKYQEDFPNRLIEGTPSWGYDQFFYGYDALDYMKDVSKELNVSASVSAVGTKADDTPFGGNISYNSNFKSKYSYSAKYSFASVDVTRHRRYIRINEGDATRLCNYLSDEFTEDLKRYTPDKVVEIYGTHVLLNITLGGRYRLLYRSAIVNESNMEMKKKKVGAGLNFVVKALKINLSFDRTVETTETLATENQQRELYVTFYGGTGTNTKYDLEKGMPTVDVQSWENSIAKENDNLTRIEMSQTYPLYDFIADPTKKAQIKAAVEKYIASKQIEVLDIVPLYQYQAPYGEFYYDTNLHAPVGGYATIAGTKFQNDGIRCYVSPNTVSSSLIKSNNLVPLYQYQATGARFYIDTYLHAPVGGYATIAGIKYQNDGIRCYVNLNTVPLSLISSNSLVPFYQFQKPYDVWDDYYQRGMFYYDTNLQIPIGANGTIASCTFHSDGIRCYVHPK